jgi:hypothetical protein
MLGRASLEKARDRAAGAHDEALHAGHAPAMPPPVPGCKPQDEAYMQTVRTLLKLNTSTHHTH